MGNAKVQINSFQFHKGAIRTGLRLLNISPHLNFNSIKVRLEHQTRATKEYKEYHFNSIKVRLELVLCYIYKTLSVYFNSIKVRLELRQTES